MVYIKNILWIDESSKEAEVTISDGKIDLLCYSYGSDLVLNQELKQPIFSYIEKDIYISNENNYSVEKLDKTYDYFIRGELIDMCNKIVEISSIHIILCAAYFPGDVKNNCYIEFVSSRFNI